MPIHDAWMNIFFFFPVNSTMPQYIKGKDGLLYKAFEEEKTWREAQIICQGDGGNLAIIRNEQTRDVVR